MSRRTATQVHLLRLLHRLVLRQADVQLLICGHLCLQALSQLLVAELLGLLGLLLLLLLLLLSCHCNLLLHAGGQVPTCRRLTGAC